MYFISNLCILCLRTYKDLQTLLVKDNEGISIQNKLKYCLPEIVDSNMEITEYVCSECTSKIDCFYNFKQSCIRNNTHLQKYLQTLKCINETQKHLSVRLSDIKYQNNPQVTSYYQTLPVVAVNDEIRTGEHENNLTCEKADAVVENEFNHADVDVNVIVKEEFEDTDDVEFHTESVKCEPLSMYTSVSEIEDPLELGEQEKDDALELLPKKSKTRYERHYQIFVKWCDEKQFYNYSENVLLAYFSQLVSGNKKSLWAIYSMLKSCIFIHKHIDISKYSKLLTYLKWNTANFKRSKSQALEAESINSFIDEAPNDEYLIMKVVLIIGVSGSLRREDLYNMALKDVEIKNDIIIITIPNITTNIYRQFFIVNSKWVAVVQKYLEIRLTITKTKNRFFLKYQRGRCFNSPLGINTIGNIPSKIAKFLKLGNCREYTAQCFRLSSANLAKRGGNLVTGKKHEATAEDSVENYLKRKVDVEQMMTEPGPSTCKKTNTEMQLFENTSDESS